MDSFEERNRERSAHVKVVTLQLKVTVDDRYSATDACQVLADAIGEPELTPQELAEAQGEKTLILDALYRKKMNALSLVRVVFENMGYVDAVDEQGYRRGDEPNINAEDA